MPNRNLSVHYVFLHFFTHCIVNFGLEPIRAKMLISADNHGGFVLLRHNTATLP